MAKTAGTKLMVTDLPQVGTATIPAQTIDAGGVAYVDVTFPIAFPSVPQVVLNVNSGVGFSFNLTARALSVTTTGFRAYAYNIGSSAAVVTPALTLGWIAST